MGARIVRKRGRPDLASVERKDRVCSLEFQERSWVPL